MNAFKFPILFFLIGCNSNKINQVKIPAGTCKYPDIELKFEPVKDFSSSLRNQKRASLYFYQLKEQSKQSQECFEKIIQEINK